MVWENGGYVVVMYYSMEIVYGMKFGEVFWVVFDIGWVVGYLYIVYVLFIYCCVIVFYEGKLIRIFDVSVFWCVVEDYKVIVLFSVLIVFCVIKKEDFNVEGFK